MANNLVLTGATFDTTAPKFGTAALNGGWGQAPAGVFGTTGNAWAWECRFRIASPPSGTQVLLSSAEAASIGYIGIDSSGHLIGNVTTNNATVTGTINYADGAYHTVAMSAGPSGFTLYCDGVVQGTNGTTQTVPGAAQFTVRGLNSVSRGNDFTGTIDEVALWSVNKYPSAYTPSTTAYTGAESGLAALWHLDGNGTDSSGAVAPPVTPTGPGNHPLTLTGATFDTTAPKFGTAALNGGWGQAAAGVLGTTGNAWAWECRFRIASPPSGVTQVIVSSGEGAAVGYIGMDISGHLIGNVASNSATITGTTNYADGAYHTVAMSAGPSGFVLLCDGVVLGTNGQVQTVPSAAQFTVRGLNSGVRTNDFTGTIDEVALWSVNKYPGAYTPSTSAYTGTESGLAALWHLDGNGNDVIAATGGTTTGNGTIAPNDANIVYSPGNWDVTSARAKSVNAGACFRMLVKGSPTALTLTFDVSADLTPLPQVMARLDRGPWVIQEIASTIALSFPSSAQTTNTWPAHLIEVYVKSTTETQSRWSPQSTGVSFTGVTTLPTSCTTAAIYQAPRKGIVFGDSITEGVRALQQTAASGKDTDRNDASVGWAFELGRELGAEIGVVGFGGSGWTVGGNGGVPAFTTTYGLLWGGGPARSFAGIDFVVINHGGNDGYSAQPAAVTTAVIAVLNGILAASNSLQIFCLSPLTGAMFPAIQAGIAACANPARVTWIDETGWHSPTADTSDGVHPYGYVDTVCVAPLLAASMQPKLRGVPNRWVHA